MIYFTIALCGKHSTDRWDSVVADFEGTIGSMYNQTSPEFQIWVACNEIPQLNGNYDERLHFITTSTPKPNNWLEGCRDRYWKQLLCCVEIKKTLSASEKGIYVFPVDADDHVNCKIAEYALAHPNEHGFKSKTGYVWKKGSDHVEVTPYFGGSMNIMRLYMDELPDEMPDLSLCFDRETCAVLNEKYPVRWDDVTVEGKMKSIGRPLERLPFRSTVYVLDTGVNLSSDDPKIKKEGNDDKRIHWGVLLRRMNPYVWRKLSKRICNEFAIKI